MVSTRHSMGADEQLISLETMTPPKTFSRSPSPKKRRLSVEDTPEQTFVDARATPFAKRERRASDSSPVRVNKSGKTSRLNEKANSGKNINASAQTSPDDEDDSSDGDDDDDDAPEAISNARTAQSAKLSETARRDALQRQADAAREKRRSRDDKLRAQKDATKQGTKLKEVSQLKAENLEENEDLMSEDGHEDEDLQVNEEEEEEEIDAPNMVKVKRQQLPRLLPDDILNAPQATVELNQGTHASSPNVDSLRHTRFEVKKEITTVKQGALTLQLLKRQRKDLAPRQSASVANTKNQWLYQRGQHSSNRRPIKKPLA